MDTMKNIKTDPSDSIKYRILFVYSVSYKYKT